MDAVLMLLTAVAGWVFAVFVTVNARSEERERNAAHAAELERRDEKIGQLIDQVQLNSQHMPFYPQVGPFPEAPAPEKYLASPDGLIVFPDYDDEVDAAFREVER